MTQMLQWDRPVKRIIGGVQGSLKRRHASLVCARAVAAEPEVAVAAQSTFEQPAGKGLGFYTGDDGYLYCDNLRIDDIRQQVPESPFYLYSKDRVTANYAAYAEVRMRHARCQAYNSVSEIVWR